MDGRNAVGSFEMDKEVAVLGLGRSETGTYWGELLWLRRERWVSGHVGLDDGLVMDDELED